MSLLEPVDGRPPTEPQNLPAPKNDGAWMGLALIVITSMLSIAALGFAWLLY
jgi:hypothetical protein